MKSDALSLDQAPPLWIPASFFVTTPIAAAAAGSILLFGSGGWGPAFAPATLALTHLGTLGFLAMAMFGALYQMLPVVAGSPVPLARGAHGVHALLLLGVGLSVGGLLLGSTTGMALGGLALTGAGVGFIAPIGLALLRAPTKDATVWGMAVALASLTAVAVLGVTMGNGHVQGVFPGPRGTWTAVHLTLGLLGWVGTLLMSVSWRVVPMFYLTEEVRPGVARGSVGIAALGLAGTLTALIAGADTPVAMLAASPAAAVIWIVYPLTTLRAIHTRRRKRADGSLMFWRAGLTFGLLCGPLAATALASSSPASMMLLGWLAIWGWAGMIMHGMLCRILPFLVWFHRLSALVGIVAVPPMRRILPEPMVRRAFWLHLTSVGVGALAIGTGSPLLARLTGIALIAVAISLTASLVTTLRVQAPPA